MILKRNNSNIKLNARENNTYMLYKDIWKFILNVYDNNFNVVHLKFNVNDFKIDPNYGIKYKFDDNYYEDCFIKNDDLYDFDIDVYLLFKLLYGDGFDVYYLDDGPILIDIGVFKCDIEKNIESILLKNKALKLEKGILV